MAAAAAPQPSTTSSTSPYDPAGCSSGLCSPSCPQWCSYFFGPPPPVFPDDSPEPSSSSRVSPIMIALITVLAAAFLLLTYYTFASKYCRRRRYRRSGNVADEERQLQARLDQLVLQDSGAASVQIPAPNAGLDEQFIKSITMFKYSSGDGLVESTDCAVCLTEFQEEESLRLMPNCQHAFHPPCIDTWLRSHSNCPICRTSMVGPPPPPPPPPLRRAAPAIASRSVVRRGGEVVIMVDADGRNPVSVIGEASSDQRRPAAEAEKERGGR